MLDWTLRIIGLGFIATVVGNGSVSTSDLAQYESSVSSFAQALFRMMPTDVLTVAIVAATALLCLALSRFYA